MYEAKRLTDFILLKRLGEGDMHAYEELFARYYPTLCAYTRLFLRGGGE